jgi:hypothetical protein
MKFGGFGRQISRKATRNDAHMGAAVGLGRNYLRPLHCRQQSANLLRCCMTGRNASALPGALTTTVKATPPPRPDSPPATPLPAIPPLHSSATRPLSSRFLPLCHLSSLIPRRFVRRPSGRAHVAGAHASLLAGRVLERRPRRRSRRLISKGLVVAAGVAPGRAGQVCSVRVER